MSKLVVATALCAVLIATAADARSRKDDHEEMGDPNRVICRSEAELGSHLARSKSCHTAAEWALIKREERQTTERIQQQRPASGN